jgi:hypothetical protein
MVEKTLALRLNEQQKPNELPARRLRYEPPSISFTPFRAEERMASLTCGKLSGTTSECNEFPGTS